MNLDVTTQMLLDPPQEPPEGVDRLVWRLAWQIHTDHGSDPHGWCRTCRPHVVHPCGPFELALSALACAASYVPPEWPSGT